MAKAIAQTIAESARMAVCGSRCRISCTTGVPKRNDVPRSPRARPVR
jgi:hypothetical protein